MLDAVDRRAEMRKTDLQETETRIRRDLSDLKASLGTLNEWIDAIEDSYPTKRFILASLIAVGGLIVAAMAAMKFL